MTLRDLRMLDRDTPATKCSAGCTDRGGPFPWSPEEFSRVRDDVRAMAEVMPDEGDYVVLAAQGTVNCPFSPGGGCEVSMTGGPSCAAYLEQSRPIPGFAARMIANRLAR
jgi:hypothetical protein